MKKKTNSTKLPKFKNGKTPEAQCSRCVGQSYPKRQCPVRESKCIKCSRIGHWAKACKSPGVECNIDDVLVHGKDQQEHDEKLEAVLKLLVEAGVTLNLDKCQFSTDRHLADKTKSIRVLLHKGNQWTWGSEQQKAFEQIKADLTQVPVLALYDPNKETKVAADASSYGLGGVVLQLQPDNSWRTGYWIRSTRVIKGSLSAVSGPKALFGGQD
ncbi:hypothetical protein ACROYT_G000985 [Oculina patagonica]